MTLPVTHQDSARLLASIVASSNDAVIGKDLSGRITSWNAAAERILGYTAAEMVGAPIWRLIPADRQDEEAKILEIVGRGGSVRHFETQRIRKDGCAVDVSVTVSAIRDEAGIVMGASKILRDITAELEMRSELRRSETRLRRMFEMSQDGILILDGETGVVADVNPLLVSLLGFAREELVGKLIWEIPFFKEVVASAESFAAIKGQGCVRHEGLPAETKDGRRLDVEFFSSAYPVATGEQVQFNVRDVTEAFKAARQVRRLNAELADKALQLEASNAALRAEVAQQQVVAAELRATKSEFQQLAESMPQMVWSTGRTGVDVYFNQQWTDYTGLQRDESAGHGWTRAVHVDDQAHALEAWDLATKTGEVFAIECRLRRSDGAYRWWLVRAVGVPNPAGEVLKWFGTCTDIHDMKSAQLTLALSEKRFASIFNAELVGFGISEAETARILELNEHCANFFGYSREEMLGATVSELGLSVDAAGGTHLLTREGGYVGAREAAFRRKSGEVRHGLVSVVATAMPGIKEELLLFAIVDLTERKKLEAQLLQSQKMEAIGRLAGGVAHDFNNSLGVILGYAELLMRKAAAPDVPKLSQILRATERATRLTRQLLAFSRKQVINPRVVDINGVLADLATMLGRLIGEDIALTVLPGTGLGRVKVDESHLEQAVINLCVNARDAMPEGGSLRIETANVEFDAAQASRQDSISPGRYVRLTIADSGSGIEESILPKIFEPFFTTKEDGKGTGLGLAMVYGAVKQAGGTVSVYSEIGHGTAVSVYLPCTDEQVAQAGVEGIVPPGGWETILLVEDDEPLRGIASEMLTAHGYTVLEAADTVEAVALASKHAAPIHLLLTDVVMPGGHGRGLAELLGATRPSLKVLFMSGYTNDALNDRGVLGTSSAMLEKPFTALALITRVQAILHPAALDHRKRS